MLVRAGNVTSQNKGKQRTNLVLDEPASEGLPDALVLALQATDQHDIAARSLHVQRSIALGGAGDSLFVRHQAV
jgi:predicted nucleotidyltransferase